MEEQYLIKKRVMTLVDPELGIRFQEPFAPQKLPKMPLDGQVLRGGYLVHVLARSGPRKRPEEVFMERGGKLEGQCCLFYSDGTLKAETFYQKGKLHGPSTFFSEGGNVLAKGWFIQGQRQGKRWEYYPSGTLFSLQRFRDGVWDGKQEFYHEDGTLRTVMYTHPS